MRLVIVAVAVCLLAGSCAKGTEALMPSTRRGWGAVVVVVGAAWLVTGVLIATTGDLGVGERVGYSLGAEGIGAALIYGGWKLGRFGASSPAPATGPPATAR